MERTIINDLIKWKNNQFRKPLILMGARQVGKTYTLKMFGEREYENVAYISCDNNPLVKGLFEEDYDVKRIIMVIGAITGETIKPNKTLIILDEIQELHKGLSALKYFCEDAPEYHIAVAGSLLGITLHNGESAPVGKVDIIKMYPMTFEEFLMAMGKTQILNILHSKDWGTIKLLRQQYIKLLREYYFVGGMPDAVMKHVATNDASIVRKTQIDILEIYRTDMSKHASKEEVIRITQVWNSIPSQLAKENKKFIYGMVKSGARAKEFELAIQWLVDAGLVHKVQRAKSAKIPLKAYEDFGAFKLFMLDTGLLGALSAMPPGVMLSGNEIMEEAKGAFTENFVLCQLVTMENTIIYYFSKDDSTLEIDFLVQNNDKIIPVEVKAEENLRSKSLHSFISNHPELKGVRLSMSDFRDQEWMENVPLYATETYFHYFVNPTE